MRRSCAVDSSTSSSAGVRPPASSALVRAAATWTTSRAARWDGTSLERTHRLSAWKPASLCSRSLETDFDVHLRSYFLQDYPDITLKASTV